MYHRRLFLARKNGGSLKLRRLSLLLYSKRFLTYFLIFTAFFNWLWCYYIQFPFTKPLIFRHKLFIFRPVCSYYVHLFQPFIWFTSCYCLCFVISNTFKSNARETWCVILVSESWHILLRITAHPRGAFISVGDCTPTEKDLLLLTTCRSGSLLDWDENCCMTPAVPSIVMSLL